MFTGLKGTLYLCPMTPFQRIRWFLPLAVLAIMSACAAKPMPISKIEKYMIGTWEFRDVDGAPGTIHYPKTTYAINADSTCSQRIGEKYREGKWKWEMQ